MDNLNMLYPSNGLDTWSIVCGAVALLGAIVAAYYFLRPQSRTRYTGLMQKINAHVNFKRFVIPLILKFLYVFSVIYIVCNGIVTLITVNIWTGVLMIVLGPVAVRVAYELVLMLFSIHDGVRETNRLLKSGVGARGSAPQAYARPGHTPQEQGEEPHAEQPKHYPGGYDPLHKG